MSRNTFEAPGPRRSVLARLRGRLAAPRPGCTASARPSRSRPPPGCCSSTCRGPPAAPAGRPIRVIHTLVAARVCRCGCCGASPRAPAAPRAAQGAGLADARRAAPTPRRRTCSSAPCSSPPRPTRLSGCRASSQRVVADAEEKLEERRRGSRERRGPARTADAHGLRRRRRGRDDGRRVRSSWPARRSRRHLRPAHGRRGRAVAPAHAPLRSRSRSCRRPGAADRGARGPAPTCAPRAAATSPCSCASTV